jgi:tryptophan 7-halogenase
MSVQSVKKVVILGGGSAGWLAAGVIAAEHNANQAAGLSVTLIESPNISPIGVGEGTWPSMRLTLKKIGVSETDFFRECEASFKQGAKFAKWVTGERDDYYYHPLVLPFGFNEIDLVRPWQQLCNEKPFGDAVCFQGALCEAGKAPKQITTPEYASVANYAYHLNATKLGEFLKRHCREKLGVQFISDDVTEVISADNGDIAALRTKDSGDIAGDLFVDCSGMSSLLLGRHFGVPFKPCKDVLFNDAALAVQVPYPSEDSPIASHTISTAQSAGWTWDIGLPTRRGIGYTYSTAHIADDAAEKELRRYIAESIGEEKTNALSIRKISYNPGHRTEFWHRNCVAVGLAAGFLEPLEASALVLVEASARMISEEMPATRDVMDIAAKRFNRRFHYYWDTIINFLKLHYILTKRTDTQYWVDAAAEPTIPDGLRERLQLWRRHVPNKNDFPMIEEMFPAASWQYVLYGMGFKTEEPTTATRRLNLERAKQCFQEVEKFTQRCLQQLTTNRELIDKIHQFGLPKV